MRTKILCLILIVLAHQTWAQDSKSEVFGELERLEGRLDKKEIADTAYLKKASLLLHNIFGYEQFDRHIRFFKNVISRNDHYRVYLREYYRLQYRNADVQLKAGTSLYYLSQLKKVLPKGDKSPLPLIIAKSQINIYCDTDDSASALKVYTSSLPLIDNLHARWNAQPVDIGYLWDAHDLLQRMLILGGAYKRTDIIKRIHPVFRHNFDVIFRNTRYNTRTDIYFDSLCYLFGSWFAHSALKDFSATERVRARVKFMVEDSSMRKHPFISAIQLSYQRNNYEYFLGDNYNLDSGKKYLQLYETNYLPEARLLDKLLFLHKKAEVLRAEKQYPELVETLDRLVKLQDTLNKSVSKDLQESQYAQAEAEETKDALLLSEQIRQRTLLFNRTLIGVVIVVIVLVLLLYQWIRLRQNKKLLLYQQSLARNLHDETGPMLLYAKILAQKQIKDYDEKDARELEAHLATTMESVRGLSHDLKSDKLQSSDKLFHEFEQLFEKLQKNLGIQVILKNTFPRKQISFFVYNELKNILNELITNSVKHSDFDTITLTFRGEKNKLLITYSDNGKGFKQEKTEGVGLHNISERARKINSEVIIHNNFPHGYLIEIPVNIK